MKRITISVTLSALALVCVIGLAATQPSLAQQSQSRPPDSAEDLRAVENAKSLSKAFRRATANSTSQEKTHDQRIR